MNFELDRKSPPLFKTIDNVTTLKAEVKTLTNNIPLHIIKGGMQDVVEFSVVFNAGSWYQYAPLIAGATNNLIQEGTNSLTSSEISEKFDFYGAYFLTDYDYHNASLSLYSLKKYFNETLTIVKDIVMNPSFVESELKIFKQNRKQQFLINQQKVEILAHRKFVEVLYGLEYPYGRKANYEDYDRLNRQQLVDFHEKYYTAKNCQIYIAGKTDSTTNDLIETHFGKNNWNVKQQPTVNNKFALISAKEKKHFVEKKNAVQSSIRIGKRTINKAHSDYIKLQTVVTILGGYIGSRLMKNLREDKGYTYGVGASIVSLINDAYFVISLETATKYCNAAIDEVYNELKTLRTQPIDDEELKSVKNHLLGEALRAFDGPFNHAEIYRDLLEYGYSLNYIDMYIAEIQKIDKEEIMRIAEKYLHEDTMFEIVAGNKQ